MKNWRVLIIDDNPEMTAVAHRELTDAFEEDQELRVEIVVENDFDAGYELVRRGDCDVVILDVKRDPAEGVVSDDQAGRQVFSNIQAVRFLPVIFWTALPEEVSDREMKPLVAVFKKDDIELIPDAIRAAINSNSVEVMAGIEKHVAETMREHMWQELAPNWNEDTEGGQLAELSRILITRVAQSLQDQEFPELTAKPSHCYLYPPVSKKFQPGDLLRGSGTDCSWWSILTPACDLAHPGKSDFVLLAQASPLSEFAKYQKWAATQNGDNWKSLEKVLSGNLARYQYLPAFREIPELLLDLENVRSIRVSDLDKFERVASLVSPYAEALLVKNSHFRGRVGIPDLNSNFVKEKLIFDESKTTKSRSSVGSSR